MIMKLVTKESFGSKLKYLREQKMLNQEQLGVELGVRGATVSRWEKGHMLPALDMRNKIFEFFDKNYDFFASDDAPEIQSKEQVPELRELQQVIEREKNLGTSDSDTFIQLLWHYFKKAKQVEDELAEAKSRNAEIADMKPNELVMLDQAIKAIKSQRGKSPAASTEKRKNAR